MRFGVSLAFNLLLLSIGSAWAGTYYVSPAGSGTVCSTNSPCAPSYAMANAAAGDTWLFKAGIYSLGTQSGDYRLPLLQPANSGVPGSPIVFRAETALTAVLQCTGAGTPAACVALGSEGKNYITWDGFKVVSNSEIAYAFIYNATGVTVQNSEFAGYTVSNAGSNVGAIKIDSSSGTLIKNNFIHDYIDPADNHNTSAIWTQASTSTTVEGNTLSGNTVNVYSKYTSTNDTYRFNFFTTPHAAGDNVFVQNYAGLVTGLKVYQNVIVGGASSIHVDLSQTLSGNSLEIYNNTIYSPTGTASSPNGAIVISDGSGGTNTWSAWNNIIYSTASTGMVIWTRTGDAPAYLGNNDYYLSSGTPTWIAQYYGTACLQTALGAWQSVCGFDSTSIATDPGCVTPGGTTAASYKRSSYPTNGRGGTYASVIGAYITGSEVIGYSAEGTPPVSAPTRTVLSGNIIGVIR